MRLKLVLFLLSLGMATSVALAAEAPASILNASYDVSRELFAQLNPVFIKQWQDKTRCRSRSKSFRRGLLQVC
jgi:sulfate/thiosulfate transport system substrate-binding protein